MKRLAALLLLLPLTACGFRPLYAPGMTEVLSGIYVEPVAEREGYELRNSLIDLLDSDGSLRGKRYRLTITLENAHQGVALQNDAAITRYNDTITASYVLTDLDGQAITRGTQTSLTSYNVVSSPFATQVARQDAAVRSVSDIANRIRLDLATFFRQRASRR